MNLIEVQKYLKTIGCIDAINLDGGGSTVMKQQKELDNNPEQIKKYVLSECC